MEIYHSCRKLSYFILQNASRCSTPHFLSPTPSSKTLIPIINPTSLSATQNPKHTAISSSLSKYTIPSHPFPPKSLLCREKPYLPNYTRGFSSKSKSNHKVGSFNEESIIGIVTVVKRDKHDMESELNRMGLVLSPQLISEVFSVLNTDGVSGLRFFNWVREKQVPFHRSSDFCSLIIHNLGCIKDYNSMLPMMKAFSREKLCLTDKAFAFLPNFSNEHVLVRDYVTQLAHMLNEAGGSCRNSGVFALIKMLCTFNSFDLATMVMEETARRTSYYNVLVWAKSRSCNFQEAYDLFDEMRRFGCDTNVNSYNYLLGSLCKYGRTAQAWNLFQEMDELGYCPDEITFEVIISHVCRLKMLDVAVKVVNWMILRGIEPRHTTHAVIIKGYFYCNRFQEAHAYVFHMCDKCKCSGNMNYSLLAGLLQRSRRVVEARGVLVDMMEKGLKPNFPVYIKVLKDLHKRGMGYLVADLKSRFSMFHSKTDAS